MSLQTFAAKCVETGDCLGYGEGIQTNRTCNVFFTVFQERFHSIQCIYTIDGEMTKALLQKAHPQVTNDCMIMSRAYFSSQP